MTPAATSLDDLVAKVRADAAQAWGLGTGAALRVDATAVTWSDGGLGCPAPGQLYTQALVPGWRIVVSDGARERSYHASQRGQWLWCPPGRAQAPLPGPATR